MPIFTAIATAALGAVGLGGTFLVGAWTPDPFIKAKHLKEKRS